MQRHVTVGVDESTESLAAAHWAAREAGRGTRVRPPPYRPTSVSAAGPN